MRFVGLFSKEWHESSVGRAVVFHLKGKRFDSQCCQAAIAIINKLLKEENEKKNVEQNYYYGEITVQHKHISLADNQPPSKSTERCFLFKP